MEKKNNQQTIVFVNRPDIDNPVSIEAESIHTTLPYD